MYMHVMEMCAVIVMMVLVIGVQSGGQSNKKKRHSKPVTVTDCGTDPDRPIQLVDLALYPNPALIPGRVRLSAALNVTQELPSSLSVHVTLNKYFFGLPFQVPCHKNIGSCVYKDVCGYLSNYFYYYRCPKKLRTSGIPCGCPFTTGLYQLDDYRLKIPEMEGIAALFASGEFEGIVQLMDEDSNTELGCIQVVFNLRKRRKRHKPKYMYDNQPRRRRRYRRTNVLHDVDDTQLNTHGSMVH